MPTKTQAEGWLQSPLEAKAERFPQVQGLPGLQSKPQSKNKSKHESKRRRKQRRGGPQAAAHTFNLSAQGAEAGGSLSPVWSA